LKITPAHDPNDHELGKKHNLETIDIFDETAHLNETAQLFVGEDRFKARKLMAKALEEAGHLVEIEEIDNKIGYSERTHVIIEPRLTDQWFVKMKSLAEKALKVVRDEDIKFFPKHQENTYYHWLDNIRDWCISRQLWWGQRIPAYYLKDGKAIVAKTKEAALEKAKTMTGNDALTMDDLRQDDDVVDTWFSSWLWPMSVFDGFEDKTELDYYYPTKVVVTGADIIFFWVARMIMAGMEFEGQKPFDAVYFTGMVRDEQRRKMSKSLGNSPDALKLIEKYGADGVRVGMLFCSPAGGDLLFNEELCEQGAKFCNKIWNALRLVKGWEVVGGKNEENQPAIDWFENKLQETLHTLENRYDQYRISEALKTSYSFVWTDFCSDYLEMIKPPYQKPIDLYTYETTVAFFEEILKMLHPLMPFITEEIYHQLREREAKDGVVVADFPKAGDFDEVIIAKGDRAKEIMSAVKNVRAKFGISPHKPLAAYAKVANEADYTDFHPIIVNKATLKGLEFVTEEPADTVNFLIGNDTFYVATEIEIDVAAEKAKLEEELKYHQGFKQKIEKKLSNERFVNNAPEAVVAGERKKMADSAAKITAIEEALAKL